MSKTAKRPSEKYLCLCVQITIRYCARSGVVRDIFYITIVDRHILLYLAGRMKNLFKIVLVFFLRYRYKKKIAIAAYERAFYHWNQN